MPQPSRRTFAAASVAALVTLAAPGQATAQTAASPPAEGEVRKIDRAQAKLTLKHGPIASLDMPPMTMVFKVADPKLLDGLKDGDRVRFTAERIGGTITVTGVELLAK